MQRKNPALARAVAAGMRGKGRPRAGRREHRVRFWEAIARGVSSENAAVEAGVLPAIGVRWFRKGGGMPSLTLSPGVRAVFVLCGARRDRGAARWRSWSESDRSPARAGTIDDLPRAAT